MRWPGAGVVVRHTHPHPHPPPPQLQPPFARPQLAAVVSQLEGSLQAAARERRRDAETIRALENRLEERSAPPLSPTLPFPMCTPGLDSSMWLFRSSFPLSSIQPSLRPGSWRANTTASGSRRRGSSCLSATAPTPCACSSGRAAPRRAHSVWHVPPPPLPSPCPSPAAGPLPGIMIGDCSICLIRWRALGGIGGTLRGFQQSGKDSEFPVSSQDTISSKFHWRS